MFTTVDTLDRHLNQIETLVNEQKRRYAAESARLLQAIEATVAQTTKLRAAYEELLRCQKELRECHQVQDWQDRLAEKLAEVKRSQAELEDAQAQVARIPALRQLVADAKQSVKLA